MKDGSRSSRSPSPWTRRCSTDLRDRIRRTSGPDHPAGAGWEYGTDPGYLRSLLATWATHGFPSSFVEHLELLPLHTDPAAHGGQAGDAFDVVVTSLPGYGFSDPPAGPMLEAATADRWCRLLRDGLGYERFGAHGSDVGAGVTIQLGRRGRDDPARPAASRPAGRHPPQRLLPRAAAAAMAAGRGSPATSSSPT
jgi:pimeloyl-ACP methyl ester carboxylesterase